MYRYEQHCPVTVAPGAGDDNRYRLTEGGRALGPIVGQLGHWGQRRLAEPPLGDLDPEPLVYDICREIDRARLPASPLIVQVDFADATRQRHWWLALSTDEVVARAGARGTATVRALIDCLGQSRFAPAATEGSPV